MKTTAALAIALLAAAPAKAAIVLSGDFINGTGTMNTPTLTITEDIVFTIVNSGNSIRLLMDEWTVSDAGASGASPSPPQDFAYELNGTGGIASLSFLVDNLGFPAGDLTPNDGHLNFGGILVTAGDVLTVSAGTYTFAANPNFNPLLNGTTFTGNVFLAESNGTRLSDIVSLVPEPSALLLSALGLLPILRRKR